MLTKHHINFGLVISGTLTVEQIYQDRDKFATLVREVAAPDVGRMGIEILSFTIKVCLWLLFYFCFYFCLKIPFKSLLYC